MELLGGTPPPSLLRLYDPQPPSSLPHTPVFTEPKERSTFYSFHYADVFRVNHVRNAGAIRPHDRERLPTARDRSLWEKVKASNPGALKAMINRGLEGTSVTAILAGEWTWLREWVRYEIARSLERGNGLLTVFIDGCQCPKDGFGRRGPNPLSFMALGWNHRIYEKDAVGNWVLYPKFTKQVAPWPKWLAKPPRDYVMPLDNGTRAYDWINDNGRDNLIHWTHAAALAAGK